MIKTKQQSKAKTDKINNYLPFNIFSYLFLSIKALWTTI